MKITPTTITAAAAGVFSAVAWPILWTRFGGANSAGGVELIIGTLLIVALPAHAFVVGFKPTQAGDGRTLDTALLKRIGSWLGAGLVTALAVAAFR